MSKFLYSNIESIHDLKDPDSDSTRIGFFAEWFDGVHWRICLCAIREMASQDLEKLDAISKSYLESPFGLLFESADRYLKRSPPVQEGHHLPKLLTKLFPASLSVQATHLFSYETTEDRPEQIFDDLKLGLAGKCNEAHWYHLPFVEPVGIMEMSDEFLGP